jgi:NAD(P)-dependent dehydrogenase (short-subunit alcohol dehydrogenase family)
MGALDCMTALITGGARGQGCVHALTLAREGADIVVCDVVDAMLYLVSERGRLQTGASTILCNGLN